MAPTPGLPRPSSPASAPGVDHPPRILRFLRSERLLHWGLAVPFVLLYLSALVMVLLWSEPQPRQVRAAFALAHRVFGLALIVFPVLALVAGRKEWRAHLANLKEAWTWTRDDFRWLILFPRAALNRRIRLPDQGKFNAAEKLNFMMVSVAYPVYIATGLLIWLPGVAFLPWLVHCAVAVVGIPLVVGHIFMATVNPDTRVGLSGMITGWVDREWAKHHYRRWYRQHFEKRTPAAPRPRPAPALRTQARVRCSSCREVVAFDSWEQLLQRLFQVEPLFCPSCRGELGLLDAESSPAMADEVLRHLEAGGLRTISLRQEAPTSA